MGKGKQGQTEKDTLCVRVWETNKGTDRYKDRKTDRENKETAAAKMSLSSGIHTATFLRHTLTQKHCKNVFTNLLNAPSRYLLTLYREEAGNGSFIKGNKTTNIQL